MIISAQDHQDLLRALVSAQFTNHWPEAQLARWADLHARLNHPIATTAVIQAVPTAREVEQ